MIYRKWSLLTGPTAILAGIIGTVIVADLLFVENYIRCNKAVYSYKSSVYTAEVYKNICDWLLKSDKKKQESANSTK